MLFMISKDKLSMSIYIVCKKSTYSDCRTTLFLLSCQSNNFLHGFCLPPIMLSSSWQPIRLLLNVQVTSCPGCGRFCP